MYARGSAEQFERMRQGSPLGELEAARVRPRAEISSASS